MIRVNRILVPTDFSDNSKAAIEYGCELARQFKAELHLLNVVENNIGAYSVEMDMFGIANYPCDVVEAEKRATNLLDDLPGSTANDCSIVRKTEVGFPCSGIIQYANTNDIELIVISTHGHTGLTHLLMGSVAENVVRTAPCPVLTVRPDGHQFVRLQDASQPAKA